MNVTKVAHARKEYYCDYCGKKIKVDDSYIWWKPRNQNIIRWCVMHGDPPKSLLTSSYLKKTAYESIENILDQLNICLGALAEVGPFEDDSTLVTLKSELGSLYKCVKDNADKLCEIADRYYESAQNIKKQFGETAQYNDCIAKNEMIYEWAGYLDIYRELVEKEYSIMSVTELPDEIYISQVIIKAMENLEGFTI